MLMTTKTIRLLILAGLAFPALAASLPASAHDGFGHGYGGHWYARPHFFYGAPRFVLVERPVLVYRPAPVYYTRPAPVYYTRPAPVYYTEPAPMYYAPAPALGAVGGAIVGGAIG